MTYVDRIIFYELAKNRTCAETFASFLSWRGYLVRSDGNSIYLHEGSTERDVTDCAEIAGELQIEFEFKWHNATGVFYLNGFSHSSLEDAARTIFSRVRGWYGFSGRPLESRQAFYATAFGAKVDTADLDPGIALLVKSIPRIACRTWCSCDGHHLVQAEYCLDYDKHLDGIAAIHFAYDLDRAWFQYASEIILSHLRKNQYFKHDIYQVGTAEEAKLTVSSEEFEADTFEERCFLRDIYIQNVARELANDKLIEFIRSKRPQSNEEAMLLFEYKGW